MNKSPHKLMQLNDARKKKDSELIWSSVPVISITPVGSVEKLYYSAPSVPVNRQLKGQEVREVCA